jgi:hypothetical protein
MTPVARLASDGDKERAIRIVEGHLKLRPNPHNDDLVVPWMRLQLSVAELYHQTGRTTAARALEAEVTRRLVVAEPGFPELRQLSRLRAMP